MSPRKRGDRRGAWDGSGPLLVVLAVLVLVVLLLVVARGGGTQAVGVVLRLPRS